VAINEAGDDQPALRVDTFVIAILSREGICRPDPRDVTPSPG
jgi:hypothetical protein